MRFNTCLNSITLLLITVTTLNSCLLQEASAKNDVSVSTKQSKLRELKYAARKFEDGSNYAKADQTYLQALSEARQSGSKLDILEILTRLIHERAFNGRILETDEFIRETIEIVKNASSTNSYDPEISVHMDDIADTLYSRGEMTLSDTVKDFCARRYLDVELPINPKLDRLIVGRASLVNSSFAQKGKWREAVNVSQEVIDYWRRTSPGDYMNISFWYLVLGNNCLGAKNPVQAVTAYNESLKYTNMAKPDPAETAVIQRKLSQALAIAGKLEDAKKLANAALQSHIKCAGRSCSLTAWDAFVLGDFEQRSNNREAAETLYQLAFDGFKKSSNPISDASENTLTGSGLALSAEKLAEITTKTSQKSVLEEQARRMRLRHPSWDHCGNPDPTEFFRIYGYLPYPVSSIPSRSANY